MPSTETRRPGQGLPAEIVRAALLPHAEELFRAAFGEPVNPAAHEWRARGRACIAMVMRGERRGLWFDHAADASGDLLDLVALTRCGLASARADLPRALAEAERMAGTSAPGIKDRRDGSHAVD